MDIAIGSAAVSLPRVDVAVLSRAGQVDALRELQRARAWVEAGEQRLLASLGEPGDVPRGPRVSAAAAGKQYEREEIACALQLSPMTVNDKLHTARRLVSTFPTTLAVLETGQISMRHARQLVEATEPLSPLLRAEVESAVLAQAVTQTPSRFRQSLARAVLAVDPRGGEARHEAARTQRRVQTRALPDGMGSLYAVLSAEDLQAVKEAVQAAADAHPTHAEQCTATTRTTTTDAAAADAAAAAAVGLAAGGAGGCPDPDCAGCVSRARTADQRRADALVALVTGLEPAQVATRHGRRPSVQVSVALSTLLNLDDQPGDLDGYGPIPADVARRIAADPTGTWHRLVTDPLGHLIDYGRSTYRPPQDLTDHVIARDRTCRFPGCNRQARTCELDHLQDWDLGGHTAAINMLAGCPRHHHLRHDAGWTVTGNPETHLTWTTPTGHSYTTDRGTHPIDTTTTTGATSDTGKINGDTGKITSDTGKINSQPDADDDPDPPPF